ncbi:MAG: PilC/PilY family type IV pilus protein [Betaproteobacteria bacterium]
MQPAKPLAQRLLAYALCALIACPLPVQAFNENVTDIANSPVTQPASSSLQPNILLILDDSGSMARQFTPDYASLNNHCFDSGDGDNSINNTPSTCWAGDPPAMSPEFNTQYYNPEIRYRPAVDYTGIERASMTCLNTGGKAITAIVTGNPTILTTANTVTVGSIQSFVDFTGADAAILNNNSFTVTARTAATMTINANTTGKAITTTGTPCTNGWTATKTDNVSAGTQNDARINVHDSWGGGGTNFTTLDIANQWPDRVWCKSQADVATDTTLCKTNSAYTYPNAVYGYGEDTGGNRKYVFGQPYYYRIAPTEYCTDVRMNDCLPICVGAATPPACILSAVAPDNVVAGKSYSVAAPVRFCTDSGLGTCAAKRSVSAPTRTYPKFIGNVASAVSLLPVAATATIRVGVENPPGTFLAQPDTLVGNITSIVVTKHFPDASTLNITIANATTLVAGESNCQWAERIENAIDAKDPWGLGNNTAAHSNCGSSNTVTITAPANLSTAPLLGGKDDSAESYNGATITINTNVTGHTEASFTWTFSSTAQNNTCTGTSPNLTCGTVSSLQVNSVEMVNTPPIRCNAANCNSGTSATRNTAMRDAVSAGITLPPGWTKSNPSSTQLRVTAPTLASGVAPFGSAMNGKAASSVFNNKTSLTANGTTSGGTTTGDVFASTFSFSGGNNEPAPGDQVRSNLGTFSRVTIKPGQTFPTYAERTDCISVTGACNYNEEMTNFANWFSYYRTRIQMSKSAIGRAFALAGIGDNFRVGFDTINFSTSKYLAVAPFVTGAGAQKDLWFQKLYASPASNTTPLRVALTRAGRYFGDRFKGVANSMGASPINSACQPNFALLTSDGYWNDAGGSALKLDGTALGDADGDGTSGTLADIAAYYYNTDLRPIPFVAPSTVGFKDQVPPSGDDTAPHQHMTTFTIGMGVSGSLLFHPNYQTPGNSIDYDTIVGVPGGPAGTNAWPAPTSGTETTVDDMWHAAVNGKGRFFSAQNPVALAAGINEVLTAVQKRVGAGAAAATSNLQPVAGDNFAFTAQYQTVDWSGDLKARTISLSDGVVGERELWSAQSQLDLRTMADRVIYTFDAGDTNPAASVVVDSIARTQNGNKLRSFCRPDAPLGIYPTCTDGGLITIQEKDDWFDPLAGVNGALSQAGGWPGGDARRTAANASNNTYIFRYLRGERAREITLGGVSSTDLFRARTSILGDIVNAQPAYVKSSPFAYSAATDPYYATFQATTNGASGTRKGTVYVAANDGMLHAFETDPDNIPYYQNAGVSTLGNLGDDTFTGTLDTNPITGEGAERWAYVPNLIFPTMKRLAEANYATNHKYFTDGSPAIGDICLGHTLATPCSSAGNWRTILVAGLNAGGRGFYALDISDPDNPKGLWEVAGGSQALVGASVKCLTNAEANSGLYGVDCNIGYSFGNPIIAKRAEDGKWVVFLTSGYNNVNPGSGVGYLYMVDAQTGKILRRMSTSVGCAVNNDPDGACVANIDSPSGLARINAWVDSATTDNTAKAIYGGDLLGNLWRFQLDNIAAIPRYNVTRLASVVADGNVAQPITVRPDLATVSSQRVVFFGTGKFLGDTDKASLTRQSIYAIKDTMTGIASPEVDMSRPGAGSITGFKRQDLTEDTTSTRTVAMPQAVNFGTDKGWFIDLPDGGTGEEAAERVSVDPIIQLGTLVVASNVPSTETCLAGGSGWVNFLDIRTGANITGTTANPASVKVSGSLIVGINIVKIGDQIKTIVTTADNQQLTKDTPVQATGVTGRRVVWRELIVE